MTRAGQRPVRAGRAGPGVPDHGAADGDARAPCRCRRSRMGGAWTGSGDNRPRAFATGSAEDVTVREYRRGDDLRRVHWRSSARVGELMVRREEQPWQSRATLFLDNRTRAHRGQGIASSLEAAVSAAASIAVHLSQRGFTVRLVTATGEDPGTRLALPGRRAQHRPAARGARRGAARPRTPSSTSGGSASPRTAAWWSPSSAALDDHDQPMLRRMLHHAGSALAIALDVERGSPGPATGPAPTTPPSSAGRAGGPPTCARATGSRRCGRSSAAAARTGPASPTAPPPPSSCREGSGEHPMTATLERPAAPPPASGPPPARERLSGRMGTGASTTLALSAAAAGTTWLAMFSWSGFTDAVRAVPRTPLPARRHGRRTRHRAPARAAARAGDPGHPGAGGVPGRPGDDHRVRPADARRAGRPRGPLDRRAGVLALLRRPGAGVRRRRRAAADPGRAGLPAAGGPAGLLPAAGPAGRAAAADDLHHPGQPDRRGRLVVGVRGHQRRLPADALPPGERAALPLGTHPRPGLRGRRPERLQRPHRRRPHHRRRHRRRSPPPSRCCCPC